MKTAQEQLREVHAAFELFYELDGRSWPPELRPFLQTAFLAGAIQSGDLFMRNLDSLIAEALSIAKAGMRDRCIAVVEDFQARFVQQHYVTAIDELLSVLCKRLAELMREIPC